MIKDTQLVFSGTIAAGAGAVRAGQSLTVDTLSTNVIDTRNATTPALVDEGIVGGDMWLVVTALTAAAGGDSAKTLTIYLVSDAITAIDATSGGAGTATYHYSSKAFAGSEITAGATLVRVKLPSGDYERYLGVFYDLSTTFTAFTVAAFLTPDVQRNVIYPSGFTVDA